MKRGDIVTVLGRGDFATKPRPALIVQSDLFNEYHPAVTICPITTHVTGDNLFRIPVAPDHETGLLEDSEIEIDRVQAVWRHRVKRHVGTAPDEVMSAADQALRRWLDL